MFQKEGGGREEGGRSRRSGWQLDMVEHITSGCCPDHCTLHTYRGGVKCQGGGVEATKANGGLLASSTLPSSLP